jgi:hypothetical protein
MNAKPRLIAAALFYLTSPYLVWAQDLGPQKKKFKDGIYVYLGKEFNPTAGSSRPKTASF